MNHPPPLKEEGRYDRADNELPAFSGRLGTVYDQEGIRGHPMDGPRSPPYPPTRIILLTREMGRAMAQAITTSKPPLAPRSPLQSRSSPNSAA